MPVLSWRQHRFRGQRVQLGLLDEDILSELRLLSGEQVTPYSQNSTSGDAMDKIEAALVEPGIDVSSLINAPSQTNHHA